MSIHTHAPDHFRRFLAWKPVLLLIPLALGIAIAARGNVRDTMMDLVARFESWGFWGPVAMAAVYTPASLFLVPASILTLGAGFIFGVPIGVLAVSIGSTVAASISFLLGRTLARPWVARQAKAMPRFRALDEALGKEALKVVFLLRLSPAFPFNIMNYLFGLTRVSLRDYVLGSWSGMLPATVMYVYLGSSVRQLAEVNETTDRAGPVRWIALIVSAGVTVLVTAIVTRAARQQLSSLAPDVSTSTVPEPLS